MYVPFQLRGRSKINIRGEKKVREDYPREVLENYAIYVIHLRKGLSGKTREGFLLVALSYWEIFGRLLRTRFPSPKIRSLD